MNQYVVVKTLGRGSFGKVKLCLNTMDGLMYAVKVRCFVEVLSGKVRPWLLTVSCTQGTMLLLAASVPWTA